MRNRPAVDTTANKANEVMVGVVVGHCKLNKDRTKDPQMIFGNMMESIFELKLLKMYVMFVSILYLPASSVKATFVSNVHRSEDDALSSFAVDVLNNLRAQILVPFIHRNFVKQWCNLLNDFLDASRFCLTALLFIDRLNREQLDHKNHDTTVCSTPPYGIRVLFTILWPYRPTFVNANC